MSHVEENLPNSQCEALLEVATPLAHSMLAQDGAFHPYGRAVDEEGEVFDIEAAELDDPVPDGHFIERIEDCFDEHRVAGGFLATALVYDAQIDLDGESTDAIAVELRHRCGYASQVLIPYHRDGNEVVFGERQDQVIEGHIVHRSAGGPSVN